MAGFKSFADLAKAQDEGRVYSGHFSKTAGASASNVWQWIDLSMGTGNPMAQYYAASPLEAAALVGRRGIYHGDDKTPYKKFLTGISLTATSANMIGKYLLADYLLFYPFIDGTSLDEQQMVNDVTLPRYASEGGKVIAVATAALTANAYFDMRYINQDGVERSTGYVNRLAGPSAIGNVANASAALADGSFPYLRLYGGDTGVRSISSITLQSAPGGLIAFAIIKPLQMAQFLDANNTTEKQFPFGMPATPEILDGAYLNFLASTAAAASALSVTGRLDFAWSK